MEVTTVDQARKTDNGLDFMLRVMGGERVECPSCRAGVWSAISPGIYQCDNCNKRIVPRMPMRSIGA